MSSPYGPAQPGQVGTPIRLMTVDDYPIFPGGLAVLIDAYSDFQLVATAANGREALEAFRLHRPGVTLMDLRMPVMGGVDAIIAIISEFPEARRRRTDHLGGQRGHPPGLRAPFLL